MQKVIICFLDEVNFDHPALAEKSITDTFVPKYYDKKAIT